MCWFEDVNQLNYQSLETMECVISHQFGLQHVSPAQTFQVDPQMHAVCESSPVDLHDHH